VIALSGLGAGYVAMHFGESEIPDAAVPLVLTLARSYFILYKPGKAANLGKPRSVSKTLPPVIPASFFDGMSGRHGVFFHPAM